MRTATTYNSKTQGQLWRTDTKSLVGGVVMGVAFMLIQQISGRLDLVLSPALFLVSGITWATFTGVISMVFKQPAGIIMGETQGMFAVATGLSPVALFFLPANGLGSLAFSLVAWKLTMDKWSHYFLAQVVTNIVGNFCVGAGLFLVLKLPLNVVLISSGITAGVSTIGGTILTKLIVDGLRKSGLV